MVIVIGLIAWCLISLPLGLFVGRFIAFGTAIRDDEVPPSDLPHLSPPS